MQRLISLTLVLLFVLASVPTWVRAIFEAEDEDYSIEMIGSLRLLSAFLHYPQYPEPVDLDDEGIGAGVTRLILDGEFGDYYSFEANAYVDLSRVPGTSLGGALSTAGSFQSPYRLKYLAWDFWQEQSVQGQLGLDRLSFSYVKDPWNISAGRFPINYSVMYIFTPNDLFSPFSSTAINKIYKPGVDALRLGLSAGMLSTVELSTIMGYDEDGVPTWDNSAVVLRASTVLFEFDWALMGGKLSERWFGGASLQGDVESIGIRAEGHVGFPDRDGDLHIDDANSDADSSDKIYVHYSVGINKMFTWHNSTIGAEYMYLSDGVIHPSGYLARITRFYPDDQIYLGRHYLGLNVGGEIIPILQTNALALFNVRDSSGMGVLFLAYSIADEAEFVGGILIPWGKNLANEQTAGGLESVLQSEYGLMPVTLFFETRSYF